jgi:hypothetical protein
MKYAFAALSICLGMVTAFTAADDLLPRFKITKKRDTDKVDVRIEKDKTLFIVKSPFGISQADIERVEEKWPDAVFLRLHLKGVEHFRATNGKVKLEASVSLQDGKPIVRLWKDGKEDLQLDAKSPYWMNVRILGGDGSPAKVLPLKDGHFEFELPKAFFEGDPKSITLNWIDFYRN